jgi:hypothetical protein
MTVKKPGVFRRMSRVKKGGTGYQPVWQAIQPGQPGPCDRRPPTTIAAPGKSPVPPSGATRRSPAENPKILLLGTASFMPKLTREIYVY